MKFRTQDWRNNRDVGRVTGKGYHHQQQLGFPVPIDRELRIKAYRWFGSAIYVLFGTGGCESNIFGSFWPNRNTHQARDRCETTP